MIGRPTGPLQHQIRILFEEWNLLEHKRFPYYDVGVKAMGMCQRSKVNNDMCLTTNQHLQTTRSHLSPYTYYCVYAESISRYFSLQMDVRAPDG